MDLITYLGTKGVDSKSIVLGMDVFPTIIDIVLDKKIEGIDGISVKDAMYHDKTFEERTVYWNSYKSRPDQTGDSKTSVIRIGDYKLLHFVESGNVELYNIARDISEKHDLSKKMSEKTKVMLTMLQKFKKERHIKTMIE